MASGNSIDWALLKKGKRNRAVQSSNPPPCSVVSNELESRFVPVLQQSEPTWALQKCITLATLNLHIFHQLLSAWAVCVANAQLGHLTLSTAYGTSGSSRIARKKGREWGCLHETLFSFQYKFVSVSSLKLCSRHSVSVVNSCSTVQQPPKGKKHCKFHPFLKLLFHSVHTHVHVFFLLLAVLQE